MKGLQALRNAKAPNRCKRGSASSRQFVQARAAQSTDTAVFNIQAQPITTQAFQPFGQVQSYSSASTQGADCMNNEH